MNLPLSVLDATLVPAGGTNADALHNSIALAQVAEASGFKRFWVTEHHGMANIPSSSPAVMIGAIAARTTTLRVGSGGVMLPNHKPFVVAEQFGMLEDLHGPRIDLGIGRAPGMDPATARVMGRTADGLSKEDFPGTMRDLLGFFTGDMSHNPASGQVRAIPGFGNRPEVWSLGSSPYSAMVAAQLGLPYTFAHHFGGHGMERAVDLYRANFQPSEWLSQPKVMVSVAALTNHDEAQLEADIRAHYLFMLRMFTGRGTGIPTLEEAAAYRFNAHEEDFIHNNRSTQAVGTPERAAARIQDVARSVDADEVIVVPHGVTAESRETTIRTLGQSLLGHNAPEPALAGR